MSEKHLLLSASTSVVPVSPHTYTRLLFSLVGVAVVLVGAANILSRVAGTTLEGSAVQTAFAPAASLLLLPAGVATTTPLTPARIKIPSIGVDAVVEHVGRKTDGSMATPAAFGNVGWYELGAQPGMPGNAVFAGHVNNALTKSGVFEHLSDVKVGDYVTVADAAGKTLVYVVTETDQYPAEQAPATSIFSPNGPTQLVLITCDGAWDAAAHSYDKRFVVYARLTAR
ncbi:MAG: class F sortase [Candidatus Adlerbacteria bacterium]|nr:class F sortase [Candidatus Adlerbacteria bacterium]